MSRARVNWWRFAVVVLLSATCLIAVVDYEDYGWMAVPHALGLTHTSHGLPDAQVTVVVERYGEMYVASCANGQAASYGSSAWEAVRNLISQSAPLCNDEQVDALSERIRPRVRWALQIGHALPYEYVMELRAKGLLDAEP